MIAANGDGLRLTVFWARTDSDDLCAYSILNRDSASDLDYKIVRQDALEWVSKWTGGTVVECDTNITRDVLSRAVTDLDDVDREDPAHLVVAQMSDGTFGPFGVVTRDDEVELKNRDLLELVDVAREETTDGVVLIVPLPIDLDQVRELFVTPTMNIG